MVLVVLGTEVVDVQHAHGWLEIGVRSHAVGKCMLSASDVSVSAASSRCRALIVRSSSAAWARVVRSWPPPHEPRCEIAQPKVGAGSWGVGPDQRQRGRRQQQDPADRFPAEERSEPPTGRLKFRCCRGHDETTPSRCRGDRASTHLPRSVPVGVLPAVRSARPCRRAAGDLTVRVGTPRAEPAVRSRMPVGRRC
jgi:hypothetical protein